jgi:hypothetical protein
MYIAQSLNNSSDERLNSKPCAMRTCLEEQEVVCSPRLVFCKEPEYALHPIAGMTQGSSLHDELKQMIHGDVEEIVGFGSVYLMCDVVCLDSEENIY